MGQLGKLAADALGDPTQDVAAILRDECFLCGKPITKMDGDKNQVAYFGPVSDFIPQLPAHTACFDGKAHVHVVKEYHRRIHDLAGVARMN